MTRALQALTESEEMQQFVAEAHRQQKTVVLDNAGNLIDQIKDDELRIFVECGACVRVQVTGPLDFGILVWPTCGS
jgi:hypothetical protein